MPLAILRINGRGRTVVVCDHCSQRIETAADGNYQFLSIGAENSTTPVLFTHKHCCRAFERQRPTPAGTFWAACELDILPFRLEANLEVNSERALLRTAMVDAI